MARKQPESEQASELSSRDLHPEREMTRAQWARIERQWEIADLHHEFGEFVSKYGPVFHSGKPGLAYYVFKTDFDQTYKAEDYDLHIVKTIAEHVDHLSRHIDPTDTITVSIHVVSMVPLPEQTLGENHHHCDELQGVEHED